MDSFSLSDKAGDDLADITKKFNSDRGDEPTPFGNCGVMVERQVWTTKCKADYDGDYTTLGDILVTHGKVPDSFILEADALLRDKG